MINETQATIISAFAKANKVSKDKAAQFACQLLETIPKRQGRGITDKTAERLQNAFAIVQNSQQAMTAKQVALSLGVTAPEATNYLKALIKAGKVMEAGKADKLPNVRGRAASLFTIKGE